MEKKSKEHRQTCAKAYVRYRARNSSKQGLFPIMTCMSSKGILKEKSLLMQPFKDRESQERVKLLLCQTAQKPICAPCGDILCCFTVRIKLRPSLYCISTFAQCFEFRFSVITEAANSNIQFRDHETLTEHMLKFSWPQIPLLSLFSLVQNPILLSFFLKWN